MGMRRGFSTGIYRRRRWQRIGAMISGVALAVGGATLTPHAVAVAEPAPTATTPVGSVLVFHGPADTQKDPVARATEVLTEIGQQNGLTVDESTDPAVFTAANLDRYRAVVFLSAD